MKKKKDKRVISIVLSTIIALSAYLFNTSSVLAAKDKASTKDYLVVTNNKSALSKVEDFSIDTENILKYKKTNIIKTSLSDRDVTELRHTDGVESIEKDIILTGSSIKESDEFDIIDCLYKDVDSEDLNLWYLDSVGTTEVNSNTKIKIELLDSGVNYSSDIDVTKRVDLTGDNINPLYEDFSGHGTSMASVIAAKDNGKGVTGINPNAQIYSVKALDDKIEAPLSRIVEGIQWGIENDMDIINMSFGTYTNSTILKNAIEAANRAGILLISATGNDGENKVQYPAAYPEVLAVGSMNENSEISDFTSHGDELAIVAPGEKIETTGIFGTINGTSGTSISTAEVSAVASKILEKDNTKTPDFVKGLLLASARRIKDSNTDIGALDGDYALEIYNDYESSYDLDDSNTVYVNSSEISSYNTDGFVNGLWNGTKHAELVDYATDELSLKENQLKLIKAGARAADKEDVDGYNFKEITPFHGTGNYVASLKCAWSFVAALGNGKSINAARSLGETEANKLKAYGETDTNIEKIIDMINTFWVLDTADFRKIKNSNGAYEDIYNIKVDNTGKKAALCKAIGLCLHIVGDTFAHRTQVPKSYKNSDLFTTKYFPSVPNIDYSSTAVKKALVNAAQNNNVPNSYKNLQSLNEAIGYEVVEFRDFKYFCPYYPQSKGVNSAYEDNPDIYKTRYSEAEEACYWLIKDIEINNSEYKYKALNYEIFIPVSVNCGKKYKLSSFKDYVGRAGYDNEEFSSELWDMCTSYLKKVTDDGKIVNK